MTKEEFIQRFQMQVLPISVHKFRYPQQLKSAAVLIPILSNNNQLEVVLTKRASHLTHHPGQISFPGGKVEKFDANFTATALRETQEVSEVFHVPLSHFLQRQHHIQLPVYHHGEHHKVHFMPYNQYNIWGATAAMLHDLSSLLDNNN